MRPTDINSCAWHLVVNVLAGSPVIGARFRTRLLRRAGFSVHDTARVGAGVFFFGAGVEIASEARIGDRCYFDTRAPVSVGAGCTLASQVMVCTSTHDLGPAGRRAGPYRAAPVILGAGARIGARATILPGVTIGEDCTIAAGAVVTRDCLAGGAYSGVPARLATHPEPARSRS